MKTLPPGLQSLFPFHSQWFDLGDARLHYVDEGAGPAIVLLHGNPSWSFMYRDLIAALRVNNRIIAVDHIGCGLSDKPAKYPYTLERHIENVGRLVDKLQLEKTSLVLHDWGGAIGLGWAIRNPARVHRILLGNTAAFLGPVPFRIRVCRWPLIGALAVRALNLFVTSAVAMACCNRSRMTPMVKKGYLFPYDGWANRIAIHRFVQDIPVERNAPSRALLLEIQENLSRLQSHPMMIVWGGRDFCFNDAFLQEWIRRFPGAQVHRFANAGHYVFEDAAAEIAQLSSRFFSQAPSKP